ncbi:flotillin family protein [Uliginosibacterium flavum]|uniref:Membrane protein YqiK n=1 Tax=Uliginosibacterium flavum TaxID=1396831 RepID=A0ABV2TNP8_9RHOO
MEPIYIAAGLGALFLLVIFAMFAKFYRKVEQGYAMIVNTLRAEPDVIFTGRMVYPIIHKAEMMDIALKTVEIDRTGTEGLICQDNIRADIKVKFFVRVNKTAEDVLKVAQGIGCERASSPETLEELFSSKFSEALKTVGKAMDFVELYQARDKFRDEIIRQIGDDLSGYVLEDAAIDYLEQTPLSKLDPSNILDAQGIKKITELTAIENVRTNELRRNEEMQIKKKDVETRETMLELERQQADAEARQAREINNVRAREQAESNKVASEEHTKSELARLQSEQLVSVQQENVLREKEVAENNRKRAVAIEEEKVTRARELEIVDRQKEVTLQEIEKDKAVEIQKKAIADVVRERIIVDRTVAEQEEAIKELRVVAEADRNKKAVVIAAEGKAEETLVLEVKAAEADERRARHKAAEEITLADAKLKVAEKDSESKKREAEGLEAMEAAPGLASAKVMMATADAKEKQGMVDAKVKIAEADAFSKYGAAEANALRSRMDAEADGKEKLGMADVHVRSANADATVKAGQADAQVVEARFQAEAKGLREKFEAMKAMSQDTREHEEFRMQLERAHTETMAGIEAQTGIAKEQAEVLGAALSHAKIDIVGGQGDYFDSFVRALSIGKGIDGAISKSDTLKIGLKDHLSGERDMVGDVRDIIGALGGSAGEIQNLSVAALLTKVARDGNDSQKAALQTLIEGFRK